MPNIIGEGFSDEVLGQIKIREQKYGSVVRDEKTLAYQHGKTAWVKMISSVNVGDITRFKGTDLENQDIGGNKLAQKFVLFNGTLDEKKNEQRAGFDRAGNIFSQAAYGLGGLEFGLRAMPGISSVNITSGPRGSLRFGEVKLKAWNRTQFEIIDNLYLRLGFTVLLEWGHSNYFYNNNTYEENNPYSLADTFLKGGIGQFDVLAKVRDHRKKSNGNYDALYGKVANFTWTFEKDGSYDITVKIVSMGDVIESLKMNSLSTAPALIGSTSTTTNTQTSQPATQPTNKPWTDRQKKLQFLYTAKNYDEVKKLAAEDGFTVWDNFESRWVAYIGYINSKAGEETATEQKATAAQQEQLKDPASTESVLAAGKDKHDVGAMLYQCKSDLDAEPLVDVGGYAVKKYTGVVDVVKQTWAGDGKPATYYIRLGSLLKWYNDKKIVQVGNKQPLIKFDYDTNSNYMYKPVVGASADPRICMVRLNYYTTDGKIIFPGGEVFFPKDNVGLIMNVYLNFEFILSTMDSLVSEGKTPLLPFLEAICNGINDSFGNINKLEPVVDEEEHIVRIIDQAKLPNRDQLLRDQGKSTTGGLFTIYGFRQVDNTTRGSFISDFNIQTEISKDTAAMITIGAQANGKVVGEDATAFSRWNSGLIDRIEPTKLDPNTPADNPSLEQVYANATTNYLAFLEDFKVNDTDKLPIWDDEKIDTYKEYQRVYLEYSDATAAIKQKKASPKIGFLPINMSLTMEGLSGMKVYQKFSVESAALPSNYPTALEFIIKTISHTIQGSKWETKIESLVVPNSVVGEVTAQNAPARQASRGTVNLGNKENLDKQVNGYITGEPVVEALLKFLDKAGIPKTAENIKFVRAWKQAETTKARNSLFGSTQPWPGATKFNKAGVKNYATLDDSIAAHAKTIKNRYYKGLYGDLVQGKLTAAEIAKKYATTELVTWGTGELLSIVLRSGVKTSNLKIAV